MDLKSTVDSEGGVRSRGSYGEVPRVTAALLVHVNFLLMLFSGATLATSARLAWDPSAYLPLQLFLPLQYRALLLGLPALSAGLIGLANLALIALRIRRAKLRRAVLLTNAVLMSLLALCEAVFFGCLGWSILQWLKSDLADLPLALVRAIQKIRSFASYFEITEVVDMIEATQDDVLKNVYVAALSGALVAVLQAAAVALAVRAACARRAPRSPHRAPRPLRPAPPPPAPSRYSLGPLLKRASNWMRRSEIDTMTLTKLG